MAGALVRVGALLVGVVGLGAPASAQLFTQPTFSVNAGGPSTFLRPDTIYINFDGPPVPIGGGTGIGAGAGGDDLDGYSLKPPGDDFIVCVSVDPATVGKGIPFNPGPPGPLPPFNVFNQSERNQHTGDAFLGSEAYNRLTGILPPPISSGLTTNFLSINQSAPYFLNYALQPVGSPDVQFPKGTPADDVDGVGRIRGQVLPSIYFTMSRESPSLPKIAGAGADSGADVFFDPEPTEGGDEAFFATAEQLGLTQEDDIDGLAVYDLNDNGRYDDRDQVMFSLTRDSPSLLQLEVSPADILTITFGTQTPSPFLRFNEVGLLFTDDIDSFGIIPLIDNSAINTIIAYTPAPGTAAMLAMAGVLAARRRRT
jgi:hypothetical protein